VCVCVCVYVLCVCVCVCVVCVCVRVHVPEQLVVSRPLLLMLLRVLLLLHADGASGACLCARAAVAMGSCFCSRPALLTFWSHHMNSICFMVIRAHIKNRVLFFRTQAMPRAITISGVLEKVHCHPSSAVR